MKNNTFSEIAEKLKSSKIISVFCHSRPDGDTLGGGLALVYALRRMGKTAYLCCEDAPPEKFSFLPAVKDVLTEVPEISYDTLVCVDCAEVARLGGFSKLFNRFKGVTVNIDHHVKTNIGYAQYNYLEECCATCEILARLFIEEEFPIDKDIANFLMTGLITDSGNFTHKDVSETTFKIAAYLRARGADVNLINYYMYTRQTKQRALLYGNVINKIRFVLDNRLAIIVITEKQMKDVGADKSMTEGFVDFGLTVEGVEVSVSIMEYKQNQYKTSLRSKDRVDVNKIASSFGGGGHVLASGCMLFGELEEVIERLTYAVYQNL